MKLVRKVALSSVLSALALVIAPFSWFAWGPTKAFPGQHFVNALAGVLVGPLWAAFIAAVVGRRVALAAAALTEPVGTVLISGTLAWYVFDPFFAGGAAQAKFGALLWLYLGWALSSVTGCVLGAICLLALDKSGALRLVTGEGG